MKDISEQLKKFIKDNGYTLESLAKEFGVSGVRIGQLVNGKKPFGKRTAEDWSNRFGLSAAWLLTGEGDMLLQPNHQQGNGNTNVGHHSINGNNNNTGDAMEAILKLTKMLEQERAEKEEWKQKYMDLFNNKV